MLKKTNIKTTTYETGYEDFMVDITEKEDVFDVSLYRDACGRKWFLFGCPKVQSDGKICTKRTVVEIVEANLEDGRYYEIYDAETEDIEDMHIAKIMEEE